MKRRTTATLLAIALMGQSGLSANTQTSQKITTYGRDTSSSYFQLVAVNYEYAFHLETVQAVGEALYIGGNSSHYCPFEGEPDSPCPNTVKTDFMLSEGSLSMGAIVPGGQSCYIDPNVSTVNYTVAHSAYIPKGAVTNGWYVSEDSPFFYELHYDLGVYACPTINATELPWALFAVNVTENATIPDDCGPLQLILQNATGPDAWQYT